MPKLGEIRRGREIGYKGQSSHEYIWHACIGCGKERWVVLLRGQPNTVQCSSCSKRGEEGSSWKGGWAVAVEGYIRIKLLPDDPFYPMADVRGYVREHRLVMARHLGRLLTRREVVHHKGIKYSLGSDENKQDNRLENLELFAGESEHNKEHGKLKHNS